MKTHYCPADKTTISYEGECNWCGEKEMICPNCSSQHIVVKDSRDHKEYNWIKRRRECLECDNRWNTYEISESELQVEE